MQLPSFFNVGSGMTFNIDEMSPVKVLVRTAGSLGYLGHFKLRILPLLEHDVGIHETSPA